MFKLGHKKQGPGLHWFEKTGSPKTGSQRDSTLADNVVAFFFKCRPIVYNIYIILFMYVCVCVCVCACVCVRACMRAGCPHCWVTTLLTAEMGFLT